MTDIITPEQRSKTMAAIHSTNTKPEVYFRKQLFARGFRYSLYSKRIPGHPDMYLRKYNTAVFIHGCFWHRHEGCKYANMPKSRVDYWENKFNKNQARDSSVRSELMAKQVKCLIVWECTVNQMKKNEEMRYEVLKKVTEFLNAETPFLEL